MTAFWWCAGVALLIVAAGVFVALCMRFIPDTEDHPQIEPPQREVTERPHAFLVIDGNGLAKATMNGEVAMRYAEHTGSVVALVPLSADFRVSPDPMDVP